eukprot:1019735-Pyramimonas_sp.AAC.1
MTCAGRLEVVLESSPGPLKTMMLCSGSAPASLWGHRVLSPGHRSHLGPSWIHPPAMSTLRLDPAGATGFSWGRPRVIFAPV